VLRDCHGGPGSSTATGPGRERTEPTTGSRKPNGNGRTAIRVLPDGFASSMNGSAEATRAGQ